MERRILQKLMDEKCQLPLQRVLIGACTLPKHLEWAVCSVQEKANGAEEVARNAPSQKRVNWRARQLRAQGPQLTHPSHHTRSMTSMSYRPSRLKDDDHHNEASPSLSVPVCNELGEVSYLCGQILGA